jgi:hypothetical protein
MGSFVTPPSAVQGAWVTIQAGGVPSAGTRSASVELIGIKPNRAESLSACFDNVMVNVKPLWRPQATWSPACIASSISSELHRLQRARSLGRE